MQVTDGTHTANINLSGNYTASTFVAASDGHGCTLVHDRTNSVALLVQSMAIFPTRHHCAHHGAACDTDSNPADSIVIPPRVIDRDLQAKSPNAIWHFGKLP